MRGVPDFKGSSEPLPGVSARLPLVEMFYSVRSNIIATEWISVPRPREFDDDVALEAAMRRFWADGFAATSVRDLGEDMGLGQASV